MMEDSIWRRGTGLASQKTVLWWHIPVHISTAIVHVHPVTCEGVYLTQITLMNSVLNTAREGYVENAPEIPVLR